MLLIADTTNLEANENLLQNRNLEKKGLESYCYNYELKNGTVTYVLNKLVKLNTRTTFLEHKRFVTYRYRIVFENKWTLEQVHKRRIQTEEKAKVVVSVWGEKCFQSLAKLAVLSRTILKNRMNSAFSFKSSWCNSWWIHPFLSNHPGAIYPIIQNRPRQRQLARQGIK